MRQLTPKLRSLIARASHEDIARVGKIVGKLLYGLDRRHRRIVRRNLQFTHPQWSRRRINRLSRDIFQNFGITAIEMLQIGCYSREDVLQRVRVRGEEHLKRAIRNGKGAILISAHLGNWEMSPLVAACYYDAPLVLVARPVRPELLNRWLKGLRTRFGNVLLSKKGAVPEIVRGLRQGKLLGLLIDQGVTRSEGIDVEFFGHRVPATPIAAVLARRFDCPVMPAFCVREADGRLASIVEPPVVLQKSEDLDADLRVNTQRMYDAIEQMVRGYPEQWFWFHKRWKRYHPHLYPEDLARRQRSKAKRRKRARKG
jgi:KDO2-lipid IV(A) lauroyltransferase